MSEIYEYYDEEWRTNVFKCPDCGWCGTHEDMWPAIFEELVDYRCRECSKMLVIINNPYLWQTHEAAAAGNEHAIRELGVMSGKGKYFEEFKREYEKRNQILMDIFEKHDGPKFLVPGVGMWMGNDR